MHVRGSRTSWALVVFALLLPASVAAVEVQLQADARPPNATADTLLLADAPGRAGHRKLTSRLRSLYFRALLSKMQLKKQSERLFETATEAYANNSLLANVAFGAGILGVLTVLGHESETRAAAELQKTPAEQPQSALAAEPESAATSKRMTPETAAYSNRKKRKTDSFVQDRHLGTGSFSSPKSDGRPKVRKLISAATAAAGGGQLKPEQSPSALSAHHRQQQQSAESDREEVGDADRRGALLSTAEELAARGSPRPRYAPNMSSSALETESMDEGEVDEGRKEHPPTLAPIPLHYAMAGHRRRAHRGSTDGHRLSVTSRLSVDLAAGSPPSAGASAYGDLEHSSNNANTCSRTTSGSLPLESADTSFLSPSLAAQDRDALGDSPGKLAEWRTSLAASANGSGGSSSGSPRGRAPQRLIHAGGPLSPQATPAPGSLPRTPDCEHVQPRSSQDQQQVLHGRREVRSPLLQAVARGKRTSIGLVREDMLLPPPPRSTRSSSRTRSDSQSDGSPSPLTRPQDVPLSLSSSPRPPPAAAAARRSTSLSRASPEHIEHLSIGEAAKQLRAEEPNTGESVIGLDLGGSPVE